MKRQVIIASGPSCLRTAGGPRQRQLFGPDDAVVVVDVIRSTTTAVTAVAMGRRCFPVPSIAAATALARRLGRRLDPLLIGEQGGERPAGFHFTNSPAAVAQRRDIDRPMILLSSSGTKLLHEVREAGAVYLACLRNLGAAAEQLSACHTRVFVLGAPTRGEFREEDQLCCAHLAERLVKSGFVCGDRQTEAWVTHWSGLPIEAILVSQSVAYLRATGQTEDLEFILRHVDDLRFAYRLRQGEVHPVIRGAQRLIEGEAA